MRTNVLTTSQIFLKTDNLFVLASGMRRSQPLQHTQRGSMTPLLPARIVRSIAFTACLILSVAIASAQQARPAITGISHMCIYAGDRSEEHTSELQSLRHLVC